MAKEEKKVQNEQNVNVDNIEETIRNGAVITEDVAKAAAEKIAKQRQEELTEKLIDVTIRTEYTRKRVLLSMKKTKKESEFFTSSINNFSRAVRVELFISSLFFSSSTSLIGLEF